MNLLKRLLGGCRLRPVPAAMPAVRLRVTDESGRVLRDAAPAAPQDYRITVDLVSGQQTVDLTVHYDRFISGGLATYQSVDYACHTYVKFGECMHDKSELHIVIETLQTSEHE